jgi:organic radical activating enzyme
VFSERKAKKHSRIEVPFDVRQESHGMTPGAIMYMLKNLGAEPLDLIVISGGEPFLQQQALADVVRCLGSSGYYRVSFETAGTIIPEELHFSNSSGEINYVVSPKMASSGNALERRYNPVAINTFNAMGADFKFVVANQMDELEVDEFVTEHEIPRDRVWVMPEGIDAETILSRAGTMSEWASKLGYNLTLRQHILLYGDERKR